MNPRTLVMIKTQSCSSMRARSTLGFLTVSGLCDRGAVKAGKPYSPKDSERGDERWKLPEHEGLGVFRLHGVLNLARVGPIGIVPFFEGGFDTFRHGQTLLLAESGIVTLHLVQPQVVLVRPHEGIMNATSLPDKRIHCYVRNSQSVKKTLTIYWRLGRVADANKNLSVRASVPRKITGGSLSDPYCTHI